jgi:hypothetical protein
MAAAATLGLAASYQPDRLDQWRQRAALGGKAAACRAKDRAGFSIRGGVLSGLPDFVRARLERARADLAPDRRRSRARADSQKRVAEWLAR